MERNFKIGFTAMVNGTRSVEIQVKNGEKRAGKLVCNNGSITWFSKNKRYGTRIPWDKVDGLFS